jgi:hypothetical protein
MQFLLDGAIGLVVFDADYTVVSSTPCHEQGLTSLL